MPRSPTAELKFQLNRLISNAIQDVHTAIPGEIVSVNTTKGLARVKPHAKMTFSKTDSKDYPSIVGVPIVFPYVGSVGMVFPIKAGDPCLIVFSEQAVEEWLGLGSTSGKLKHSLAGAICIPGIMRTPTSDFKDAQENGSVIIRNGDTSITLNSDHIVLKGDVYITGKMYAPENESPKTDDEQEDDFDTNSDESSVENDEGYQGPSDGAGAAKNSDGEILDQTENEP